jgi:hypothetical protein
MRLSPFAWSGVVGGARGGGAREERRSIAPRSSRAPGMGFGHELLVALIMAVAMVATLLLYR